MPTSAHATTTVCLRVCASMTRSITGCQNTDPDTRRAGALFPRAVCKLLPECARRAGSDRNALPETCPGRGRASVGSRVPE